MSETPHVIVSPGEAARKPYHVPVVRTYGNIQEITQTARGGNKFDAGPGSSKTAA
jgi:hypothetical protein